MSVRGCESLAGSCHHQSSRGPATTRGAGVVAALGSHFVSEEFKKSFVLPHDLQVPALVGPWGVVIIQWCTQIRSVVGLPSIKGSFRARSDDGHASSVARRPAACGESGRFSRTYVGRVPLEFPAEFLR